ncbi:MAG: energy transducer TonB [Saprospiraceae bacterium]
MENMQSKLIALLFIAFAFVRPGASQGSSNNEFSYEVNRVYPPGSITKEKLMEARTLIDLDKHYQSSWVREYISVEILASYNGKIKTAPGKNDTLNREQKDLINMADPGTDISVRVRYLPENTLKHNDIKETGFTVIYNPESEAEYPGGQQQLKQYLKEKAIDKIPAASFQGYDLAAIKFTIDEAGLISDAHVFWPSNDIKVDELLLGTICNMPAWKPAAYSNGIKVKQEFVLTVGNMSSCVVPLLNISQD